MLQAFIMTLSVPIIMTLASLLKYGRMSEPLSAKDKEPH